jgi:hypothetical protein
MGMYKEDVVAAFEALTRNQPGESEENDKKAQITMSVTRPGFTPANQMLVLLAQPVL